jgi:hypothetical protein
VLSPAGSRSTGGIGRGGETALGLDPRQALGGGSEESLICLVIVAELISLASNRISANREEPVRIRCAPQRTRR